MTNRIRKGLHDIATRSARTDDAKNPQRKYLGAASLELKKALCQKVRDAARRRIVQMDRKIADLDAEMAQLLGSGGALAGTPAPDRIFAAPGRGFTLKY
jgi:hypothetical protein